MNGFSPCKNVILGNCNYVETNVSVDTRLSQESQDNHYLKFVCDAPRKSVVSYSRVSALRGLFYGTLLTVNISIICIVTTRAVIKPNYWDYRSTHETSRKPTWIKHKSDSLRPIR